ncbi:hypothetical protein [Geothrix sp. PMB-07]|uniref:hypothetical protein n=1 Tax=Geothrix sp. PMB-07 TaxID=3068640 RepID=UPI002740D27A|nr:hypothetical protein [Geothrix sp. PMB-07]WLT30292.1 hypothetical protein Q9293_11240 [Geothrix sp. PMB-07]
MKETPYTDALVSRISDITINSEALEANLELAKIEAISNSVFMILREQVRESLEEHCSEILDELSIHGELTPPEIERAVANKISKPVKDGVKRELDSKYKLITNIDESYSKNVIKPAKLQVLFG